MRLQVPREYGRIATLLAAVALAGMFALYLLFLGENAIIFAYLASFLAAVLFGIGLVVLAARVTTWLGELSIRL